MGLDAVEIIMDVEEAFGCKIDDDAVCEMRTVGDLYDYLVRIHAAKPSTAEENARVCLSAATFYKLRRGLTARLGTERREIRPTTSLDLLLPRTSRRSLWRDLSADMQLELPELAQPKWLVSLTQLAALLLAAAVALAIAVPFGVSWAILPGLFAFGIAYGLFSEMAAPWAIYPRSFFATVGGLANAVLARNYDAICRAHDCWDPDDAWQKLRMIIVEQLGVKPELVTRDASWVSDLGCE